MIKVSYGAARRVRGDGRSVVWSRRGRARLLVGTRSSVVIVGRVDGQSGGRRCMQLLRLRLRLIRERLGLLLCRGSVLIVVAVGIGYAQTTKRTRQTQVAVHSLSITMLAGGRVTEPSQDQTRPGASLSGYEICGVSDEMVDWSCATRDTRDDNRLDRRLRMCIQAGTRPATTRLEGTSFSPRSTT